MWLFIYIFLAVSYGMVENVGLNCYRDNPWLYGEFWFTTFALDYFNYVIVSFCMFDFLVLLFLSNFHKQLQTIIKICSVYLLGSLWFKCWIWTYSLRICSVLWFSLFGKYMSFLLIRWHFTQNLYRRGELIQFLLPPAENLRKESRGEEKVAENGFWRIA